MTKINWLAQMKLRNYQEETLEKLWTAINNGFTKPLAVLATGLGKTVIFSSFIKEYRLRNPTKKVLVLAHRAELIWQAVNKIRSICNCSVGVEMGEHRAVASGMLADDIIVSTIQTQISGSAGRMANFDAGEFGLIIIDEAHHACSPSYKKVINYYTANGAILMGVTATPDRSDKKSLGKVFDAVAQDYDVGDGIRDGWLTPIEQRMVTITGLDYSHIKTVAGDLHGGELAEELEKERNLYGVADATVSIAGDKKTLIFCASVKQAERLAEIINRHKPNSAISVSGKTDKEERKTILDHFHKGRYQYLVNCAVLTEGFDEPDTACVVFARPTKSRALYAQMLGRGTRPHSSIAGQLGAHGTDERKALISLSSKPSVMVVDFVGNCGRHKLVNSVDILGGCGSKTYDDKAIEHAKKMIADAGKLGKPLDTEEALEKAKEELEEKKRQEIARRHNLKVKALWTETSIDPFQMLKIPKPTARGWNRAKKVSDKMFSALVRFKIPNPETLNYTEAQAIISECIRRAQEGRPTLAQEQLLRKLGVRYPVPSFEEASRLITKLKGKRRCY